MKSVMQVRTQYKLLGFEPSSHMAKVLICSSGKVLTVHVNELEKSKIAEKFAPHEIKALYRHIYMDNLAPETEYQLTDRHESSWIVYVLFVLLLVILYVVSNIADVRPVYIRSFDLVITPGTFIYPFTFLIIDLLNEFYGFKLAKKAILYSVTSNIIIMLLLYLSTLLPPIDNWPMNLAYSEFMTQLFAVLMASAFSFVLSELSNSWILCKIKALTNARHLYLRIFLSTFAASVIGSFVFCFMAFYGKIETNIILNMVVIQIAIKSIYAVFNILPAYYACYLYKKYILRSS